MKFSIVIPVYNVEKYLEKCLDSVINQTYDNFEVIIVNDGSTDNSESIINKYLKKDKRFKLFNKENGGLSEARNYGLKYVTGDYVIFLDSDDYLETELLEKIYDISLKKRYDCIKFLFNVVDEKDNIMKREVTNFEGDATFDQMILLEYSNSACCYAFNVSFWLKNKFSFEVGKVHEDFGIVPVVLALSKENYIMNFNGYNYLQHSMSITNGSEKSKRRAYDMLFHYDNMMKKINNYDIDKNIRMLFNSYIANGILNISKILNGDDLNEYINEIKKRKVYDKLLDDTILRKIKKTLVRINIKAYIKIFIK